MHPGPALSPAHDKSPGPALSPAYDKSPGPVHSPAYDKSPGPVVSPAYDRCVDKVVKIKCPKIEAATTNQDDKFYFLCLGVSSISTHSHPINMLSRSKISLYVSSNIERDLSKAHKAIQKLNESIANHNQELVQKQEKINELTREVIALEDLKRAATPL